MYDYLNSTDINGVMNYPTQATPFFWLWILTGIWFIMTLTSYYKEVSLLGRGKLLSSMVVSAFFVLVLATIGTGVGFITSQILIYILIFFVIFAVIFIFSDNSFG